MLEYFHAQNCTFNAVNLSIRSPGFYFSDGEIGVAIEVITSS